MGRSAGIFSSSLRLVLETSSLDQVVISHQIKSIILASFQHILRIEIYNSSTAIPKSDDNQECQVKDKMLGVSEKFCHKVI